MRQIRRQLLCSGLLCCIFISCCLLFLDARWSNRQKILAPDNSINFIYLQGTNNSVKYNFSLPDARLTANASIIQDVDTPAAIQGGQVQPGQLQPGQVQPALPAITMVSLNYTCRPSHSVSIMKSVFPKFNERHPVFVANGYRSWDSRLMQYQPPFGLKSQENVIDRLMRVMTDASLSNGVTNIDGCRRCIIVGSGGILKNTHLGSVIDNYDMVFRANGAPVKGYETDVGSKTTIRVAYPEAAPKSTDVYDPIALFGMVAFKARDLEWLEEVIANKVPSQKGFWTKIAKSLPKHPQQVRLINPMIVQEAAFDLLGFPVNNGKMSKNVPTTGTISIMAALRVCDEVDVAGFGYHYNEPHAYLHYYESIKMSLITKLFTHDISHENNFLRTLVQTGVIKDLTRGIH